jgi:hypothetical protein
VRSLKTLLRKRVQTSLRIYESAKEVEMKITKAENEEKLKNDNI